MTFHDQSTDDALLALLCELDEPTATPAGIVAKGCEDAPLSFAQEQLWLLAQLDPNAATYNQPRAFVLHGALRPADLQQALDRVIDRHDILRSRIAEVQGQPRLLVEREARLNLRSVDLRGQPQAVLQTALEADASTPFDLAQAPLLRACLYQLDTDRHVLTLTSHHSISDAWSNPLLLRDLAQAYASGHALPRPAVQYHDFAHWQRGAYLTSPAHAQAANYWRDYLQGGIRLLELPTDHPRNSLPPVAAGTCEWTVSPALFNQLQAACRTHGLTPFMVLLAAWQLVLGRRSGQDDFILGVPNAGRNQEQVQALIGYFVNSQIHRARLDPRQTVAGLFDQVRRHALACLEHADHPLEQVLAEQRQGASGALFHCLFNWTSDNAEQATPGFAGLRIEPLPSAPANAKFDLSLNVQAGREQLRITLEYDAALFEAATAQCLGQDWLALLQAMLDNPHCALGELQLQATAQHRQQQEGWNATAHAYPATPSIHALVEAQVRSTPDAIALVFGDTQLSYGQLNRQANQLAHTLIAQGVRQDTPVGIAAERSLELVVGLLAILKAGGAYVPLDPEYPADRLSYMFEDSGIGLLLTQSHLREHLPLPADLPVLLLDDSQAAQPEHDPQLPCTPEQLAYVIYTSGSTGRPKGAGNSHQALANRLQWMQAAYGLDASDTVLQKTPFSFDVSVWEFFWPLITGARLAIAAPGDHRDPARLVALIERHRVTTLHFVPSMLQAFLLDGEMPRCGTLQRIICSGEALPVEAQLQVFARLPQTHLYNLYGPTEAAIDVTHWTCLDEGRTSVPIGTPIANLGCWILDANLQPQPAGAIGELYLSGVGLARGYHRRPALTAERFVVCPFRPGERMYRTGDLARYRADGVIEYCGRIDHQVKIRGLRIELGEIEARLMEQPAIHEAAVLAVDNQLVAYLVHKANQPAPDRQHLSQALLAHLPDYMVPNHWLFLDAMPLSPNGKLDRKALPPLGEQPQQAEYLAPSTALQRQVAATWAELLKAERVGLADDFFALGGHSLLVARVVSRLRHELALEFPLHLLFDQPRLGDFCQSLANLQSTRPSLIEAQATREQLPLSFAQERQWLLWKLDPASTAYHIPSVLHLNGPLDVAALNRAFDQLIARHETLRTAFSLDGAQPRQQILAPWSLNLQAQALPETARDAFVGSLLGQPFDLASGRLLRVGLARMAADEHLLVLVQHHIVSDAWSMQVMVRELCALYQGQALPPLALQYADFAAWQRGWLDAGERERQLAYWRTRLGGEQPVLELPCDHPRRDHSQRPAGRLQLTLPDALAQALQGFASAHQATVPMVLLSAWQAVLHRYTGQPDLRIGMPAANRNRVETEPLIGFFVNTLVVRAECTVDLPFAALLAQTRQAMIDAQDHQDLPYEQLLDALLPQRGAQQGLFQVLYNHHQAAEATPLGALRLEALDTQPLQAQFDLALATAQGTHGLSASFSYDRDLFEAATIARLGQHWLHLLEQVVDAPRLAIGEIVLLADDERQQLLSQWNDTAHVYPAAPSIHTLVESQARRSPDATALLFGETTLTYAQLNRQANQLAHALIAQGVRQDTPVGIAAERSLELVVGLLAILKAGGAYVPLDPEYPADRLSYMFEDSGIGLLLTQSHLREHLPLPADLPVLLLDDSQAAQPEHDPQLPCTPEQLAYVIYTSGSTGRPKGAGNSHQALANRLQWMQAAYGLDASDTVLQKTPFSFDVSVWEFFWPLITGARLAIAAPGDHRDPARLVQLIHQHQVSTLHFVPSMLQAFLLDGQVATCTQLQRIICSGEALPVDAQLQVFEHLPQARLYNLYGPTEAAIDVTHWTCLDEGRTAVPIGTPIANLACWILDAGLQPQPAGVIGELYLGGVGLARGYHQRPALTAERFVACPFQPGARMYRTGDLARYRADGVIEYCGRIDHQVKIRGLRIELGEIEARLMEQPGVSQAVVIADQRPTGARLLAYVVAHPGHARDSAALRAALKAQMPDYMVPAHCVWLDAMPLSPNGKLDRKALPGPPDSNTDRPFRAPQTPLQQQLASVWQQVLGVQAVGLDDDFFELGGHSLLVINAVSRIQLDLGRELTPPDLFQHPTLEALALHLDTTTTAVDEHKLDTLEAWLDEMEEH
ncbi:non-ribosomal peptide synthetase [Pseudomonas sp. KU43P]|uniref:non-ribosomal peptide synthetase n=1 Tax=Pseudomonas sp. KU43P TaxID=2487887 RepID=UPI0012A89290|nr:non-ribosomal peptide synthetase [Pseudomonas sp. KU43P]BBH45228.1 non-ribosomal peptide synthetase [Pseudomonas sp. KU43P]